MEKSYGIGIYLKGLWNMVSLLFGPLLLLLQPIVMQIGHLVLMIEDQLETIVCFWLKFKLLTNCKMKIVSRSNTESEYRVITTAVDELLWFRSLFFELHLNFYFVIIRMLLALFIIQFDTLVPNILYWINILCVIWCFNCNLQLVMFPPRNC